MNDSGGQSGAQKLKALHLEALPARKFCDPLERLLAVKRASLPMIFERNSERMRYARYRAQKLFVGSGVVEAGCKTVIGRRLKMSDMFWTVRCANSIIALRCNRISGKFTDYWESRAA